MKSNKKAFLTIIFVALSVFILLPALSQSANGGNDANDKKAVKLYKNQCSKCHRNNGMGIKKVYPPLKNSDYIKKSSVENIIRGMLFGRSGGITVNGVTYNGVMTTEIEGNVTDSDIAILLNYIYQKFNGLTKNVTAGDVKKARKAGKLPKQK